MRLWLLVILSVGSLLAFDAKCFGQGQPAANQIIDLQSGWNLISVQVGTAPIPVGVFEAGMLHPDRLVEIWGYSPTGSPSVPGQWQSYQPKVSSFPSDLTVLWQARGYWVNVSQSTSVTLTGVRWDGAVSLVTGWNLVGFPGIGLAEDEAQEIASVFGSNLDRVQQVWTFEKTLGRFSGYDITAIPALKELSLIKPSQGYWVYALEPITITPQPYVALPGDADASPLEPEVDFSAPDFPGLPNPADYVGTQIRKVRPASEDVPFDLNGNGIIDGPFTQSVLKFEVGVDRQTITIGNNGTGLANWLLDNSIPWLYTASSDSNTWPAGTTSRPKTASGVVSSDRDTVTLYVDTTGLSPGTQTGTMTMFLGTLVKTITVKLEVPTTAGDWKGFATTQRVNGKNIGIGAVDLGLNLFMASDATNETSFRAVLNADKSLLFPRDVFLNGVFYSGNNFSITTNFQMDAGDRNAPPYDTFAHVAPGSASNTLNSATARADRDYNGNGKLDVDNPFPFSIHRQITLLGQRVNPNRMEGSYIESLDGMLPNAQPIFIEGTFYLDRQTLTPTRKSIFNGTTTNSPITIGSSSGVLYRETTLNVTSPVSIQGVTVSLNISFPDVSKLTVYLIGPNGQIVYLSRNASSLGSTYTLSDFNGLSGAGAWKLHVEWVPTSLRGTFASWSLNVQGLATYSTFGKAVSNPGTGNQPLAGVHAILTGSNVLQQTDTDASGQFTFTGLTENSYTVTLTKPGYVSRAITFYLNNANYYIGHGSGQGIASTDPNTLTNDPVIVAAETASSPTLSAAPYIGAEPLHVNFSLVLPLATSQSLGSNVVATWNFGDGTPTITDAADVNDDITLSTAKHLYQAAGDYSASVTLAGTGGTVTVPLSTPIGAAVHVQRVTPDTSGGAPVAQIIGVGFIGCFAAPVNNANVIETSTTATGTVVYQESKRDSASFDRDRDPAIAAQNGSDFHPSAEDTDLTGQLYVYYNGAYPTTVFNQADWHTRAFDSNQDPATDNSPGTFLLYQLPSASSAPDRFRMICTMGGGVFGETAPLVGDLMLQVGRIEP